MNKLSIAIDPDKLIPDNRQGMITESGIFYRKGTTLASYDNAKNYQASIDQGVKDIAHPDIQAAINDQRFITNMMSVGLYFSFFPEIDWLVDEKQEGRMMPALLMLQQFPNKIDQALLQRLQVLQNKVAPVTKSLLDETLDYYQKYLSKLEATKKYLLHLFMQYDQGLEKQDINAIDELWSDKVDNTLIVPSSDVPVRGKEQILAFTKKNFANFKKIKFQVNHSQVDVDLIKGIAHVTVEQDLHVELNDKNVFADKKVPSKSIINVEFMREDVPSAMPVIRGFENWRLGNWTITRWIEVFPYSQF